MSHADVSFRRFLPEDVPFAQELKNIAGWNQTETDWLGYLAFEPDGYFIAEMDGKPVGTASSIRYGDSVGWIGMVLVHPDYRRHGIGTSLLNRAIEYLRVSGTRCIKLDATPMGKKVYVPLGFRDEYEIKRYEGVAPAGVRLPSERVSVLQRSALSDLVEFDRNVFGADRARVLMALSQRDPDCCFVTRRGAAITGYLIAREGHHALQVGPWAAENPAAAEDLLMAFFARVGGQRVFIDAPMVNAFAEMLMDRQGLSVQRPFTRMYLGENAQGGYPAHVYSTGGAEKG